MIRHIKYASGCIFLAILLAAVVSAIVCRFHLKVTEYDQKLNGLKEDCTVVCLSDLHSVQYGKENRTLLEKVSQQHPDAVFVLGDMMNLDADEEELDQFLHFMENLKKIAPVYFSFGNHEMDYIHAGGENLYHLLQDRDITVLLDSYVNTTIGSNPVRIGGSLGHYHGYHWSKKTKNHPPDYAMEESIGRTSKPAIVLLHMPETILLDSAVKHWTGDLYLSGHTHGGVIRIPGLGGLFAPTQGAFPKYDRGQFSVYKNRFPLIITSGLSGYDYVPRIFNLPEICVVHLKPA